MAFIPRAPETCIDFGDHQLNKNDLTSTFSSLIFPSFAPHQQFQVVNATTRRAMSYDSRMEDEQMSDEDDEEGSQLLGEKKRRLNLEQVKALESSFEVANKLDPHRKMQLATALGLHPRQIAIWFQNRRARSKTKQLEKDYQVLKRQYDRLKDHNHALNTLNKKLNSQLLTLRRQESAGGAATMFNLNKENEGSNWNKNGLSCEDNCKIDVNLGTITTTSSTNSPLNSHNHVYPTTYEIGQNVPEESEFCNMFSTTVEEEQTNYWPLPVQQHFY